MNTNETLTLPDHLITQEILPKLPAKSLIRFKSVSKSWLSTISSQKFIKTHLKLSSFNPQFLIFTAKIDGHNFENKILSLHYNELGSQIKHMGHLVFGFGFGSNSLHSFLGLVGSCNGLVCVKMVMEIKSFIVWNPAINQIRLINFPNDESNTWSYTCDFNYVSCRDEYMIFGVFSSNVDYFAHCYVFSLSSGVWKRFDELSKCFTVVEIKGVVLIGNFVYFLRVNESIVEFRLDDEVMTEFPRLEWMSSYKKGSMLQLRGCLSMMCFSGENVCDVWMLKRPSEWNSWEKLFSVDFTNVGYYGISESGKCLVQHEGQLKVIDPIRESGKLELLQKGIDFDAGVEFVLKSQGYVESLVSPF